MILGFLSSQYVFAFQNKNTAQYFNGPTVSLVTDTTAVVGLSDAVLKDITEEEKQGVYFEYRETLQACPMIYPTPESCLPKKTTPGMTGVNLSGLKPSTSYTVVYKRDNTIRCITTPCPGNEFESLSVEFTTKGQANTPTSIPTPAPANQFTKNLFLGSYGPQVTLLQTVLAKEGYLKVSVTGYFGHYTFKAVQAFQKANGITPTGYVGPLTRAVLNSHIAIPVASSLGTDERFEGTITAYSTGCFADGICSITVDGKTIVTTRGWSQEVVGAVTGIPDFGSIEKKIGAHAKVYAKKTEEGYTLYGNSQYYINVE